jgi:hypothetical protein
MNNWAVPLLSVAGAVCVAVVNYAVQRWRFRIDRLSSAVDLLCNEINSAADLSVSYWRLDMSQKDESKKGQETEAELVGRQLRIQQLFLSLKAQDAKIKLGAVEATFTDLHDAMTGGSFRVKGRAPDEHRMQRTQSLAAALNGQLRTALNERARKWS